MFFFFIRLSLNENFIFLSFFSMNYKFKILRHSYCQQNAYTDILVENNNARKHSSRWIKIKSVMPKSFKTFKGKRNQTDLAISKRSMLVLIANYLQQKLSLYFEIKSFIIAIYNLVEYRKK